MPTATDTIRSIRTIRAIRTISTRSAGDTRAMTTGTQRRAQARHAVTETGDAVKAWARRAMQANGFGDC